MLNYVKTGSGKRNIILVHGFASSLHAWNILVHPLVNDGFTTYSVDLLGHGDSPKPPDASCYSSEVAYESFNSWITTLNLDNLILIGHSFGGYICARFAKENPSRVKKLILLDPFISFYQLSFFHKALFFFPAIPENLLKRTSINILRALIKLGSLQLKEQRLEFSLSDQIIEQTAIDYKRCSPKISHILKTISPIDYSTIHQPTLLIWGEKDNTLSVKYFHQLSKTLKNVRCLKLFASHVPHQSAPIEVNSAILAYVQDT